MKSVFYLIVSCLLLCSCEKSDDKVTTNNNKPTLSANTSDVVLLQSNGEKTALTLSYDNVNFGFNEALGYVLQIAPAGSDFKGDKIIQDNLDRKALTKEYTNAALNALLLNEYEAGSSQNLEMRIITSAGNISSNVLPIKITTYEDWPRVLPYTNAPAQFLYIPGDYQGWTPDGNPIAKVYSVKGDKKYSGTIVLPDATKGFKFTPAPAWDHSYGMIGTAKMTGEDASGKLQYDGEGAGNFLFAGSGTFTLDVDLNANTWKATKSSWGIIGSAANGWNEGDDIMFDFDVASQTFYKNNVVLKSGAMKFRTNHKWDVSIGDPVNGDADGNIIVSTPGTYKVLLDLRVPSDPYWKVVKQ